MESKWPIKQMLDPYNSFDGKLVQTYIIVVI